MADSSIFLVFLTIYLYVVMLFLQLKSRQSMTTSAAGVTARSADTDFFFPFLQQKMEERTEKEKQRNGATNLVINGDHLSK